LNRIAFIRDERMIGNAGRESGGVISITDCRFPVWRASFYAANPGMDRYSRLFVHMRCDGMRPDLGSISEALIASGYASLDEQAKALGLHRSTTWTIIKKKHKLGRLSAKTINRILSNPQTPMAVRTAVQQYAAQDPKRNLRRASDKTSVENKRGWI
jgi:hypothetical protein